MTSTSIESHQVQRALDEDDMRDQEGGEEDVARMEKM